jgi:3-oxoacyl-[acyl-carrier protein] reductase
MSPVLKRALVTGGSGAIGAAISQALAEAGHHVIIHANRNLAQAQALAHDLQTQGHQASACAFDLIDRAATAAAAAEMLTQGPIQILIHNAGINDDTIFAGMSGEQWDSVINVSLNGFYNITQPLMLPMLRTRWGRIISISSVAAVMGNRGQVNYAAAKAGLHGATKSLAQEVASRNVTVNAVAPGIIESPMIEGVFDSKLIEQLVPAKRAGKPAEVASLVGYLCSAEAGYITGQIISINGGMA